MSTSHSFKVLGGWGSVAAGVLFIVSHLLNLFGNSDYGTVLGASLVFSAHLLAVFAFIGLYEVQSKQKNLMSVLGMLFGIIGTIIVCAVVYVEIAGASGVDVSKVFNSNVPTIIKSGSLIFVIGMILFGISTIRSNILPRWGGILLIIGTIVFSLGSFFESAGLIFSMIGGTLTGAGFIWLGLRLLISYKSFEANRITAGYQR